MIEVLGKEHDLGGGLKIHRIIPTVQKRMVGPFAFLDHMGPLTAGLEQNTDVRPHPHIGLSTLTYLFDGQIHHRDSLGSSQLIVPGEVNWMTAGSGISHSERTPEALKGTSRPLHGLQFWVALPDGSEDIAPNFEHYSKKDIPVVEDEEKRIHVVCGEAFGVRSPVKVTSPLIFASIEAKRATTFEVGSKKFEFAVYLVEGEGEIDGVRIAPYSMLSFEQGEPAQMHFKEGSRFVLIGGEPFKTKRTVWWNLVHSSRERIEDAKRRWKEGRFPMVPGETEFIPLPEN